MIAANATQIVDLRKQGKQPGAWVLVSFIGRVGKDDNGFTVFANPELEYDWRWVIGLDVIAFARKGQDVARHLKAIRNERPKTLSLWDAELKVGAEVHFDFPLSHVEAQRKAKTKTLSIDLDPWADFQNKQFFRMGF